MKFSRWFTVVLIIVVAAAIWFYFAGNGGSTEAVGNGPEYKEYVVQKGVFQTDVSANGIVGPIDRVEIKSKASGRIDELPVEEGDFVKKGDLICRLDQTDVQAEVDQAQADLDIAEAELKTAQNTYNRRQQLFDKGLISEEERDNSGLALAQAKGKMVRARTALDQANVRLSETIVRAPIDGVILQKYVEAGQIISSGISSVSGGTAIADIADMRFVYVQAGIDEIDVGKIRVGQEATIVAEAYPNMKFSGKIIRIAPEAVVEQSVTLFNVVIEVANKDGLLKSGMNANVEIVIVREENVLMAPTMAFSQPGEEAGQKPGGPTNIREVLLKEGDQFVPREVEVGLSNFRETVITSGLKEGDILGVPMVSRLKADNQRMEERIRSSRSFGAGTSNSSRSQSGGR